MQSELINDPLIGPIVGRFVKILSSRAAAMMDAHARADWTGLSTLAHQLAGASGSYGFPAMSDAATVIEIEAQGDVDTAALAMSISKFAVLCTAAVQGFHGVH